MNFPKPIQVFIDEFAKLPGLGPRTAARLAFWLLKKSPEEIQRIANALIDLKTSVHICTQCFNATENGQGLCTICRDPNRNQKQILVIEKETDLASLEKAKAYHGVYHVLGGTISPLDPASVEQIRFPELVERIKKLGVPSNGGEGVEVILATNPTTEGDFTAMQIERALKPLGTKITRLGRGLPTGSDIEFADEATLRSALEGRREV
ncbi:recombination protein RecR [Candidatus Azambacteria bacterium]|nr:recombination protein RecR [Candidatus Azambacteria bacterium]